MIAWDWKFKTKLAILNFYPSWFKDIVDYTKTAQKARKYIDKGTEQIAFKIENKLLKDLSFWLCQVYTHTLEKKVL